MTARYVSTPIGGQDIFVRGPCEKQGEKANDGEGVERGGGEGGGSGLHRPQVSGVQKREEHGGGGSEFGSC